MEVVLTRTRANRIANLILLIAVGFPQMLKAAKSGTDGLIERADAIVLGEVQSGRWTGKNAAFVLLVNRAIKGSLLPNDQARVSWNSWIRAEDQDLKGTYGMWFLLQVGQNRWEVLPPNKVQMYFRVSKAAIPATLAITTTPVTPESLVAAELAATLQSTKDRAEISVLADAFLGLTETPFIADLYRLLRANPDPELKFIGLTGMSRSRDVSALVEAADHLDEFATVEVRHKLLSAVAAWHDTSPIVIQAIGKIAASPHPDIQDDAALILRFIHTRETLPFLVQLLDSSRPIIRENAIRGLSSFVQNLPIESVDTVPNGKARLPQGPAPHRTTETDRFTPTTPWLGKFDDREYVQFWKLWWARNKDQIQ
jgi:hypothetical protein